jgi:anaerobic ribonucleoside-triphosphate reductase activating protein
VSRHWGSDDAVRLRLARLVESTEVLGPGCRALVVVQGCELRCNGCVAPATHRHDAGFELAVDEVAERVLAADGIGGVTFSGGEPFLQAAALSALVDRLRAARPDISTMSYSGYRLEWLRGRGSPAQHGLLDRLDLLVDGPYVRRFHAPVLWRGSRNQRIHALTGRHRAELAESADAPAGLEMTLDEEMTLEWVGVPPLPDFLSRVTE